MIDWMAFVTVAIAALVASGLLVTLFSLALRIGDNRNPGRRIVGVALFTVCGFVVVFGIFLIVPALHSPFGL